MRSARQDVCYLKLRDKTPSKLRISFSSISSQTGILPRVVISTTTTKWPMVRERGDFPFPLSYCRHADDVEIDSSLAKLVVEPIYKQLKP